jgi:hypothetical protein
MNWLEGFGLRPEATQISRTPPDAGRRSAPASVLASLFLGNCIHVEAELDGGAHIVAELSPFDGTFQPGERVHVSWRGEDEIRVAEP